jgi:hypothetical protein
MNQRIPVMTTKRIRITIDIPLVCMPDNVPEFTIVNIIQGIFGIQSYNENDNTIKVDIYET